MKAKIAKLVAVLMLMVFVLGSTVTMADEDVIVIYAQVPGEWSQPCVWAWGEDGTGVFDAWPGEKMTADADNEGWYYIHLPKWATSVIINANEGTVQTSDMATNSMDSWVVVKSPEEAVLSNEKLTDGDLPKYVPMITVNAVVPEDWTMPSLWAWTAPDGTNVFPNWPGQELNENTDGWYSYKVPGWVNSVIVNANLGSVQTSDISIEAKDVWLVIEDAETVSVSYEKPELELSEEDMIKVHATVPEDWLLPSLWAWSAPDGTNVFPNWPGAELVEDGDWMSLSVPNWVNSIIINGNLGSVQTSDISIENNTEVKDLWVVIKDAENYEVYYEAPTPDNMESASSDSADTVEESASVAEESAGAEANSEGGSSNVYILVLAGLGVLLTAAAVYKKKK